MALTPAQKQQAYRDRLKEKAQINSDAIEQALMAEVARAERGELSDQECVALANKLAALAKDYLGARIVLARRR